MAFSIFCFVAGSIFGVLIMSIFAFKANVGLIKDLEVSNIELDYFIDRTEELEVRIYNAISSLTPKSAHIDRKMAAILQGDDK